MNCLHCAAPVAIGDRFCEACGAPLIGGTDNEMSAKPIAVCRCPAGEAQPDEDGFCQVCGMRIAEHARFAASRTECVIDRYLAIVSDIGRRHHVNQDSGVVDRAGNDVIVLVVADGVSSAFRAEDASSRAVLAAQQVLIAAPENEAPTEMVRRAIAAAHAAVLAIPASPPRAGLAEPETTIVVAGVCGSRVAIGWVGDSRAYLVADTSECLLTQDDSWCTQVAMTGEMTLADALADPRAHLITQCLGMRDTEPQIHVTEVDMAPGQTLLLCSDGLWNYFNAPGELAQALAGAPADADALALCRYLVELANDAGGKDNITVALLRPVG